MARRGKASLGKALRYDELKMKAYYGPTSADFKPDANQILEQLAFWFGEQVTGEIDIGWYDPKTGEPTALVALTSAISTSARPS